MSSYGVFTKLATKIAKAQKAVYIFRAWGFFSYYTDEGVVVVRSFITFTDRETMK